MHHLKSHCGLRKPFKDRMTFLAEYGVDWWITMKHELHGNAPSQVTFIYIALLTTVLCMNDVHWTRSYFRRTLNWTNHLNVNESARSLCQEWMSSTRSSRSRLFEKSGCLQPQFWVTETSTREKLQGVSCKLQPSWEEGEKNIAAVYQVIKREFNVSVIFW